MSSSIGAGGGNSDIKNQLTYLGQNKAGGRQPGALDTLMQIYGNQSQRNQGLSDYLTGGAGYGTAPGLYGNAGTGSSQPLNSQMYPYGTAADDAMGSKMQTPANVPNTGGNYFSPGAPGSGGAPAGAGGAPAGAGGAPAGTFKAPGGGTGMKLPGAGAAVMAKEDPSQTSDAPLTDTGGKLFSNPSLGEEWDPWSTSDYQVDSPAGGGGGAPGTGGTPANGTPGGAGGSNPTGITNQYGVDNPVFRDLANQATPDGGLVGTYGDWQNNPLSDNEKGLVGQYGEFGSGKMNPTESSVYDQMMAQTQGPNAAEKGVTDLTMGQMNGPNAAEKGVYAGNTAAGGKQANQQTQENLYNKMTTAGGYDPATLAALQHQTYTAATAPYEKSIDAMSRMGAARGNPNAAFGAQIQAASGASDALAKAADTNVIQAAQEKQRQAEAGASGLGNVQNALTNQAFTALGNQANQNAQQRGYQQQGIQNLSNQNAQQRGYQQQGISNMAGQNAAQRGYQQTGMAGQAAMGNTAFGRKQAGAAGTQGIANTANQTAAGQQASLANIGGQIGENYTTAGSFSGGL